MNALCLGTVFYDRMRQCRTGQVHSVFDRVVNIVLDHEAMPDSFLSIGNFSVQVTPAMLVTDWPVSWHQLELKAGDRVCLHKSYLWIGNIRIHAEKACLWHPMTNEQIMGIEVCCDDILAKRKKQLSEDLQNYKAQLERELPVAERLLQKAVYDMEHWLSNEKATAFDAGHLIGLGRGLTPAGDDILCGALYGMYFSEILGRGQTEKRKKLREDIKGSLHKTNDISRHFLRYAVEGIWGRKEEEFLLAFYSQQSSEYREKAKCILETGASSGTDQMTGFLMVL